MKFDLQTGVSWLLAASALTTGVDALPQDTGSLSKRAFTPIGGIPGNACSRFEVRDLARNNPDQWNLFLLALQSFMDMNQGEKFSYYQVAGVHGRPYVSWNDVPLVRAGGYCPHSSNMFLPWHKPFLASFERAIDDNIYKVKNAFPADQRSRWDRAHNCFRLPYWDSARRDAGGDALPNLIIDETVTLDTPSGRRTIPNPLAYYTFHPTGAELGSSKWQGLQRTYRRLQGSGSTASSDNNGLRNALNTEQPRLKTRIFNLMRDQKQYRLFSTDNWGSEGNGLNSQQRDNIESIHNAAHSLIGGSQGGHMYYVDMSAFDPVFWLHHCNIDRWGAIFQKINPNTYVENGQFSQNNGVWSAGQTKTSLTELLPFTQRADGAMWNPTSVRYTETFGYFYPETGPGTSSQSAVTAMQSLYGPASTSNARVSLRKRSHRPLSARTNAAFEGYAPAVGQREYTATITCDKFAIDGSYVVYFFLGDSSSKDVTMPTLNITMPGANITLGGDNSAAYDPNNADTFLNSPNYVGIHGVLSSAEKQDQATFTTGSVHLLAALQLHYDAGLLSSLDDDEVVRQYLKDNLDWKVVIGGGEILTADQIPGLTIGVVSQKLETEGTADSFPVFGDVQTHTEITAGKAGGYAELTPIDYSEPNNEVPGTCSIEPVVQYAYVDEAGDYLYSSMSPPGQ